MFKRILAAAVGIFLTGQIASASINAPAVLRDGPGGSGYPAPGPQNDGNLNSDGPGGSAGYADRPVLADDDGPGLGGGYISDDGPGLGGGYISDDGPGLGGGYIADGPGSSTPYLNDGPGSNVPYLMSWPAIFRDGPGGSGY
jgi:hypothetical protein